MRFEIGLKNAREVRRNGGLLLLTSAACAVICIAAIWLGKEADNTSFQSLARVILGLIAGASGLAALSTFGAGVMALSAPRQSKRDAYLTKAQAVHEHAWLCARCHCLYFEDGHAPEGFEPLTAVPWAEYKQRLWRSVGYRTDVDR